MKKIYIFFALLITYIGGVQQSLALSMEKAQPLLENIEERDLDIATQSYANQAMTYLSILAIIYALWGGFLILTAGGEDDKVTKGKKILIQGGIGLIVIWLAGSIVKFVINLMI